MTFLSKGHITLVASPLLAKVSIDKNSVKNKIQVGDLARVYRNQNPE